MLSKRVTVEYRILLMRLVMREMKARLNEFYYRYSPVRTNTDKYLDFHKCGKKIRVLTGAPRTGKTTAALMDMAWQMLGEHPFVKMVVPNTWWVIVTDFHKAYERGGMIDKMKEAFPKNRVVKWEIDKDKNIYECYFDNGSAVVIKSQQQGIDTVTSNKVHGIFPDERIYDHDVRVQLRVRILDYDGQLIYTMDKIEDDEWVDELKDKDYFKHYDFELEDNKDYLPKQEIERLKTELDEIDKERIFYGRHAERGYEYLYPKELFHDKNYILETPKRFDIHDGELIPSELGDVRVYREPEVGKNYVMSWDVGEGVGQNPHAVQVFDEHGEQVCTYLNNTLNYSLLAERILTPLGTKYNMALAVGELRSLGYTVMDNMMKSGYPQLYADIENRRIKQIKTKTNLRFGVVTDEVNKPVMVAMTWDDLKTGKLLLHDEYTVIQLQHFVKDIRGKNKTKSGVKYHGTRIKGIADLKFSDDDLVMALFFADRALNAWDYLKPRVKQVITNIDSMEKYKLPKADIIRFTEESDWS